MASPESDSRTSSVGTKRKLNSTGSKDVIVLDSSSEDESLDDSPKKTRLSESHTPEKPVSMASVSWNQGVQGTLRTSFGKRPLENNRPVSNEGKDGNLHSAERLQVAEEVKNGQLSEFAAPVSDVKNGHDLVDIAAETYTSQDYKSRTMDFMMEDTNAAPPGTSVEVDVELEEDLDQLDLIRKYYPGNTSQGFIPRCLTCSEPGHKTSQCSELRCSLCGVTGVHFTSGCPQTRRCLKCREHGHLQGECPEKLKAVSGGPNCALCNSNKHMELHCDLLWRSFFPSTTAAPLRVQFIPHACYSCSSENHFGPECGVREQNQSEETVASRTWSRINWEQYVDPQSKLRALSAGKDYRIPSRKSLSIKGRAERPIDLEESSEGDAPFIGRQVARPPRPQPRGTQHIKFDQQGINSSGDTYRPYENPPRHPRFDSARYGRERSFSPPPQYPRYSASFKPPLPPGPPPNQPLRKVPPPPRRSAQAPLPARMPNPPSQPEQKQKPKQTKRRTSRKEKNINKAIYRGTQKSQMAEGNPGGVASTGRQTAGKAKQGSPRPSRKIKTGAGGRNAS